MCEVAGSEADDGAGLAGLEADDGGAGLVSSEGDLGPALYIMLYILPH